MGSTKFYITLMIVLMALSVNAQVNRPCTITLTGKITDFENNFPVAYVSVYPLGGTPLASTDSLGIYLLDTLCPGLNTITVSRPGFVQEQFEVFLSKDTVINFKINFDPAFFKTIEISSNRKQIISEGISKTITPKELDKLSGNLLADITKTISGVNSLNVGNNVSKPIIHGLHSNRILILNNGVRLEGQQWGSDHGPEIDPFIAHKITVVKGAGTLRYGSDIIGGVILTEPKEMPQTPGIAGNINLAGASNGRMGITSGMIEGKSKMVPAISLRLQGTLKKGGNIQTPNYFLKNTGSTEENFSFTAAYKKGRINSEIYHSKFKSEMGIFSGSHIGNITDLKNAIESNKPLEVAQFSYNIDRPFQKVNHDLSKAQIHFSLNQKNKLSFQYSRQFNERSEYDKHRPLNDSLAALNKPELLMKLTTHMAEIHLSRTYSEKWNSEIAINGTDQANTYRGRYFIPNYRLRGIGFFTSTRYQDNKNTFETSIRYDIREQTIYKYDNGKLISPRYNFKNFSASITGKRQLTNKIQITLNTASAWRPPSANELYSDGLHHGSASIEIGDPNLKPERLYSAQGVISYNNKNINLEISPYYNYIENFIFLDPQSIPTVTIRGAFPTFRFAQTNALIRGIDNTAKIQIGEHFKVLGTMSLLRALNQKTNDFQVMMPADSYRINIEYFLKDKRKFTNTSLSVQYNYVNKQWRVPNFGDLLGPPGAYGLLNIQLISDITIKRQSMTVSIGANNVMNIAYRDYLNRFRYFTDETGRNFVVKISIPIISNKTSNEKNH